MTTSSKLGIRANARLGFAHFYQAAQETPRLFTTCPASFDDRASAPVACEVTTLSICSMLPLSQLRASSISLSSAPSPSSSSASCGAAAEARPLPCPSCRARGTTCRGLAGPVHIPQLVVELLLLLLRVTNATFGSEKYFAHFSQPVRPGVVRPLLFQCLPCGTLLTLGVTFTYLVPAPPP